MDESANVPVTPREDAVNLTFIALRGMPDVQKHSRPGNSTIGQLQARLQKRLKIPLVFLCLQLPNNETFMPLPDLTLDQLSEIFGSKDAETGKWALTFAASTTTEAFP
ncbi:Hypothetical protein, putative [Bodo saltans]|uniref:Ubiquitin-like domain-containing protein n=1 Tax=Bodo saltans TaxID=75058 RepID=A0A0S4IRD4_BODSA|nr:Hypothetical protein, putative [Bodo saltans]|eukprot:CUG01625.1 Hypothetical protein, putative [Bodo saltans]